VSMGQLPPADVSHRRSPAAAIATKRGPLHGAQQVDSVQPARCNCVSFKDRPRAAVRGRTAWRIVGCLSGTGQWLGVPRFRECATSSIESQGLGQFTMTSFNVLSPSIGRRRRVAAAMEVNQDTTQAQPQLPQRAT